MQKIVNGIKYDTAKAQLIGEASNNLPHSDFRFFEESLYRTKNGRFFIAGSGGAMSKYSETVGDATGGGSDIFVIDEDEAREWCEKYQYDLVVPYEDLWEVEDA